MKLFNKNLSLIALLFCISYMTADTPFNPQQYRYFVTSIFAGKHKKKAITTFKLSNNTEWSVSKEDRSQGTYPFPVNTEVFITPGSEEYHINYLKPDGSTTFVKAWVYPHRDSLPKLINRQTICIQKEGWFTAAKYIRIWELSDGSKWILNPRSVYFSHRGEWNVGHRILISMNLETQGKDCIMINTDKDNLFKVPQSWIDQGLEKKRILRRPLDLIVEPYSGDAEQIARNTYKY